MCECEKRIDNLKEAMSFILDDIHDLFVSVTDESEDFYSGMNTAFDEYKSKVEAI